MSQHGQLRVDTGIQVTQAVHPGRSRHPGHCLHPSGLLITKIAKPIPSCYFYLWSIFSRRLFRLAKPQLSHCFCWRSLGDSNPCFRRERVATDCLAVSTSLLKH